MPELQRLLVQGLVPSEIAWWIKILMAKFRSVVLFPQIFVGFAKDFKVETRNSYISDSFIIRNFSLINFLCLFQPSFTSFGFGSQSPPTLKTPLTFFSNPLFWPLALSHIYYTKQFVFPYLALDLPLHFWRLLNTPT